MALLALMLAALACLFHASASQAQITRTARVELNNTDQNFAIGPAAYVTFDPEKKLNPQTLLVRYQNNLRGIRHEGRIINLGFHGDPAWILFSVTNNSATEDWVLHFGEPAGGRMGFAHKLFIRNETANITALRALREEGQDGAYGETMAGAAAPVTLRKGQTDVFIVYIEPESAFANTLAPVLMTRDAFLQGARHGIFPGSAVMIFLLLLIGFFAAVALLQKNPEYLLFAAFYLIYAALAHLMDSGFFMSMAVGGEILTVLFLITFITGLAITKFLLGVTVEDYSENLAIFVMGVFLLAASLFVLILYGKNGIFDELLVFIPAVLAQGLLVGLSFLMGQKGRPAGLYFASGWLLGLVGCLISALSAAELISLNAVLLNAYWYFMLPQAAFFIAGTARKIRIDDEEERHLRARQNRAERTMARLQQSKESADQARLLRVIERERELMAELREREMQRTEEMRRAKEMADEANRAKSAFLAVVSHEIRTPMTGILGMVRLLNDTKLGKDQHDYLIAIQKSGDTMMALLNDILDFEKIQSGNMQIEYIDFDLPKLVQGVITLMSGHAGAKGLTLKSDIPEDFPAILVGDPTRLRQVLLNLVSNAIKFTAHGGVSIRLRAMKLENKPEGVKGDYEIYFAVEDTGIGISGEAQQQLFSAFAQADKTVARKYGGTGLGLAICKSLVEAMGSVIRVASEPGAGSTFFFSLLMERGQSDGIEQAEYLPAPASTLPQMRILVIEDNEMNRAVMKGFLKKDGHHVVMAESGEAGIESARHQAFDVVFCDIRLSGIDGLETTRRLRTMTGSTHNDVPIIAVSGNAAQEDIRNFYDAGMNGFVAKPIDPEKLRAVLVQAHEGRLPAHAAVSAAAAAEIKPQDSRNEKSPLQHYVATLETDIADILKDEPETEPAGDDFDSFAEAEEIHARENAGGVSEPVFEQAQEKPPAPEPSDNPVFDKDALQSLLESLGPAQFRGLMDSFTQKADEITAALEWLRQSPEAGAIRDRAHELKGMAANFGFPALSAAAATIERAARDGKIDAALEEIAKLGVINTQAKDGYATWLAAQEKS